MAPQRTGSLLDIDLEQAEEALEGGWTLPTHWYSDAGIYNFELDRILTHKWYVAGSLARLAQPGDHIVCKVAEIPIVVTRDERGELHAFVNICRHRGNSVVTGDGNRKSLQCIYHGWTYGLDGTLRGVPGIDIADPEHLREFGRDSPAIFKQEQCQLALIPVQLHVWNEVVFVNPDLEAPSFSEAHPRFEELADFIGLTFGRYRYHKQFAYDVPANWKLWFENGVECYHCPTVHRSTFGRLYNVSLESYKVRFEDQLFYTHIDYASTEVPEKTENAGDGHGWRSIHIFPGTFIGQDDVGGVIAQSIATGPDSSRYHADMYVNSELEDNVVEEWADLWDRGAREDVAVVGGQHKTLRSRVMPHGRWMPWREGAAYYAERVALQAYKQALLA
jgi:phenylpropionate dioxygenase-like ring-hydroxylating dioxygenase large terminal subunit